MSQLNVQALIELLEVQDPNLRVEVEGCDCYGEAVGIRLEHSVSRTVCKLEDCTDIEHHYLLITRR